MRPHLDKHHQYQSARKLKRRFAIFCVAIMAVICLLVAEALIKDRTATLDRTRIEAANLLAGFEQQIRGTLNGIRGAMEVLKRRIEAEGATFDFADWKRQVPELVSPTINISMMDAQGNLLATSVERVPRLVSYSDRDYFPAQRDNPHLGFFVGRPYIGKLSKRLLIPCSLRLERRDGQFAGVLVFSLDPGLLTALHREVNPGKTAAIAVLRTDGVTLARFTSEKGLDVPAVGRNVRGIKALSDSKIADAGEYYHQSAFDGILRLFHWRKVSGYPLVVSIGLGEVEAFAAVNRRASIVIGLGLVALSLPLLMMLMLNREISQRVQHAIALENESENVRKTNAELLLANQRSEEANRAKSTFLANMSHELRTPLNAILGFSEIIRDKLLGKDLDLYANYAGDIHRSGAHLLNIVNNVLDVSEIEAGKLELREEEVEVDKIIQESLIAVEQQASSASVSLVDTTQAVGVSIFGDKTKLNQIIINLLSNAVKFTLPGGSVDISAALDDEDGWLSFRIRDTGIGMSGDEISHALEMFRQVDNSISRRFEGAGLGLPLAVLLTELHGGTLTLESAPGVGTTVVVRFPVNRISSERRRVRQRRRGEG
jgi:signal transduction histidine kinase